MNVNSVINAIAYVFLMEYNFPLLFSTYVYDVSNRYQILPPNSDIFPHNVTINCKYFGTEVIFKFGCILVLTSARISTTFPYQ